MAGELGAAGHHRREPIVDRDFFSLRMPTRAAPIGLGLGAPCPLASPAPQCLVGSASASARIAPRAATDALVLGLAMVGRFVIDQPDSVSALMGLRPPSASRQARRLLGRGLLCRPVGLDLLSAI